MSKVALQCKACKSRNTIVVRSDQLDRLTEDTLQHDYGLSPIQSGVIMRTAPSILDTIIIILRRLFKKVEHYVLCSDCGHWEEVKQ